MTDDWQQWGALLQFVLTAGFFGFLAFAFARRRKRDQTMVPDEVEGSPYRIFTRRHDLAVRGRDIHSQLRLTSPDLGKGWMQAGSSVWQNWIERANAVQAEIPPGIVRFAGQTVWSDWAICFLIDQSGSMKGEPMAHCAATVRWAADCLGHAGCSVAVLGFSTVGWHGGRAALDWKAARKPSRPGRLCSLLHVEYQSFVEPMTQEDRDAMMHPDILRENIDGEALEWATAELLKSERPNKLLVIVSDGAPVDDMTLTHNGPSYLWRHIKDVIATLERDERLILAGFGLNYRVDEFYQLSDSVTDFSEMPERLMSLITRAAAERRA